MHSQTERVERVNVSGIATYDEVDAELLHVSGVLTVSGETRAERAKFSGAATMQKNLHAGDITVSGAADVAGDITADEISVSGAMEVDGDTTADEISVSGSLSVRGITHTDTFECSGSVQLETAQADQFEASGAVKVATLTADSVQISGAIEAGRVEADDSRFGLAGDSVISRLVSSSIVVTQRRPDGFLRAESIEGDDVVLDYVDVERVVGDHVQLGANARVGVVQADELDVADGAVVGSVE